MQRDFHYYATYAAAILAGYPHEAGVRVAWSAAFADFCTRTFLEMIGGPLSAATAQFQSELLDANTDPVGLQDITRIWASFHFLPGDLYAEREKCSRQYLRKYRMICNPNSPLLAETVELAKGRGEEAAGLAMHVLADTWAHRYFAGTPSLAINNTDDYFYELREDGWRKIRFNHNPASPDDPEKGIYTNSLYQGDENSVMNLGHGRAGHLPDYSYACYKYLPAWGAYREIVKDNPDDYMHAFSQMVFALKYLRENRAEDRFETARYAQEEVLPYRDRIDAVLRKRQTDASADWKAFGEMLSGQSIPDFQSDRYQQEYMDANADEKEGTFLGRFIYAALAQKSMVTNRIFASGSLLAGFSVDYDQKGFRGIRDFRILMKR